MTPTARKGWAIESGPMDEPVFFTNGFSDLRDNSGHYLPAWTDELEGAHLWRSWEGAHAAAQEWAFPLAMIRLRFYDTGEV